MLKKNGLKFIVSSVRVKDFKFYIYFLDFIFSRHLRSTRQTINASITLSFLIMTLKFKSIISADCKKKFLDFV